MATHSGILAWRIPWTEGPGELQSMGWQRVGHDWATNTYLHNTEDNAYVQAPLTDHISLVGKGFLAAKGWGYCLIQSFEQSRCYYLCFTEEETEGQICPN